MKIQKVYEQMGIDYDQILDRFGDEELLRKYLNKFMKEQSFVKLQESMEKGNAEEEKTEGGNFKVVVVDYAFVVFFRNKIGYGPFFCAVKRGKSDCLFFAYKAAGL